MSDFNFMYYKPNSSFFFMSNSSCVIAPISRSSLYFFNSSVAIDTVDSDIGGLDLS